jgi:3-oxoacyl-[acyl-carrier protein] reductase
MIYEGRVAVVTGTREGVGKMVAEHLIAEYATVIGLSRGETSIEHPAYTHMPTDIGRSEQVRATFGLIGKLFGKVDYLVNCAAVASSTYAITMPVAGAEAMMATNVLGLLYVAREAAKLMRRDGGRIVNIGSIHSQIAPIGASVYAASKAAQETMVQVLSKELADWNITVNTLALSPIETSMLRASGTPEVIQRVIDGLTIPRLAEPADVFNGIDFFLSERSRFITGQTIYLGGVHG